MSKMMMGQIDHARKRVAGLKAEKLGDRPKLPTIKKGSALLEDIRKSGLVVTMLQIKKAFTAYVEGATITGINEGNIYYKCPAKYTCKIVQGAPTSVEEALASTVYGKENAAEIERFTRETELYNLRQEALDLEASAVEDAIVLGDQQAALIALQNFAAFTL